MVSDLIRLRAYYATKTFRDLHGISREAFVYLLRQIGDFPAETADPENRFVKLVHDTLHVKLANQNQQVKITSTPEEICEACPIRNTCSHYSNPVRDIEAAREFGIQIGGTYTVMQIRKKVGF